MSDVFPHYRRRMIVTVAVVPLVLVLFSGFVTLQLLSRIISATQATQKNQEIIALLGEKKNAAKRLSERFNARANDLKDIEGEFLQPADGVLPLISSVETFARAEGIEFKVTNASEKPTNVSYLPLKARYEVVGEGRGEFHATMRFLQRIEALHQRVVMRELVLNPLGKTEKALTSFRITLLAF